ncbi:zinc cluster transcription factor [Salix suchowensis]|nr:zinc cluster transcription factor [Salix suchowensis]
MILRYNYTFDRSSTEECWLLDEVQQRRRIFWEIYMYYAWTSIVNGRPPAYTPPPKARFSPSYFAQAIRQDSNDPVKQQFAQSALATYRSACRIISSLRGLYEVHKDLAYTRQIISGALVTESPTCSHARDALQEFERTLPFYEEGPATTPPPSTLVGNQSYRIDVHQVRQCRMAPHNTRMDIAMITDRQPRYQYAWSLHDYYHAFGNPYLRGDGGVVSEVLKGRNSMMFGISYASNAGTNAGYAASSGQRLSFTQPLAHSTHLRRRHAEQGGGHMQVGPSVLSQSPSIAATERAIATPIVEVAHPFQSHPQQFLSPPQHAGGSHGFQMAHHEQNQLDSRRNLMQQYGL